MSTPPRDRLTHLLTIGREADDPFLLPRVGADGSIALEPGESVLYRGDHPVLVQWHNERAGFLGNKQAWEPVVEMEKKARIVVTTGRIVYTWPKWKSDNAAGSFFERRVLTAVMERDEGKMVLGGHVRHQWATRVFAGHAKGMVKKTSSLRVDVQDGNTLFLVSVGGLDPSTAQQVAREFAASVARRRLTERGAVSEKARPVLEGIAGASRPPERLDWAMKYGLPDAMKVGFDFKKAT